MIKIIATFDDEMKAESNQEKKKATLEKLKKKHKHIEMKVEEWESIDKE